MSAPAAEAYAVAWALYQREMSEYVDDDGISVQEIKDRWENDSELRNCWIERAQVALDAQALYLLEVTG